MLPFFKPKGQFYLNCGSWSAGTPNFWSEPDRPKKISTAGKIQTDENQIFVKEKSIFNIRNKCCWSGSVRIRNFLPVLGSEIIVPVQIEDVKHLSVPCSYTYIYI
jgi:hypothetical protein